MKLSGVCGVACIGLFVACGQVNKGQPDAGVPDDAAPGDTAGDTATGDAAPSTRLITVGVAGGPSGVTLTPTSPTPGAICMPGSCVVPVGGSVSITAPGLTDWVFDGWSGSAAGTAQSVTLSGIASDGVVTATYINTKLVPCADAPPANGHSTSMPEVAVTYTTAGGWSAPAQCPWSCDQDFCLSSGTCITEFLDRVSYMSGAASIWFGGDDRPGTLRLVGAGQGVTPNTTVTMNRFGFNLQGAFSSASTGQPDPNPHTVRLDRRDAGGNLVATYSTTLPASFSGGWVFWNTPTTTLSAGTLHIFTSFLVNAFTQKANSGMRGDAAATYAGGSGYAGEVTSGDLSSWSSWGTHPWDFQFRVQQRNPACQ